MQLDVSESIETLIFVVRDNGYFTTSTVRRYSSFDFIGEVLRDTGTEMRDFRGLQAGLRLVAFCRDIRGR